MSGRPAVEVSCPNCGKPVKWDNEARWRPFCSERCKMIDLGDWLAEEHRIPGDPTPVSDDDNST